MVTCGNPCPNCNYYHQLQTQCPAASNPYVGHAGMSRVKQCSEYEILSNKIASLKNDLQAFHDQVIELLEQLRRSK